MAVGEEEADREEGRTIPKIVLAGPTPMGSRPVQSAKKAPELGSVRANIAYCLLAIFAATVGLCFAGVALGWGTDGTFRQVSAALISGEIGLLGAVMGFYYATHEHGSLASSNHPDEE